MLSERIYRADKALLLNTIWDMAELQHGSKTLDDRASGRVGFSTAMYGIERAYRFAVTEVAGGCAVRIEVAGDGRLVAGAFALLESLLGMAARPEEGKPG